MSVRESSDVARARETAAPYTRWRGLLSLTLGVILGPIVALVNQQVTYSGDIWACGHDSRVTLHIAPVLCLIVVGAVAWSAYGNWRAVGGGFDDESPDANVAARTRFLALLGVTICALSALVILAQWLAVFVFDPCVRP
jgi:hypothetical protein